MRGLFTSKKARRGFTLIELLVVIGIIALLASMLLPALATAKERGKRIFCLNNMRQLGLALIMYTDESDGRLPPRSHPHRWPSRLLAYMQIAPADTGVAPVTTTGDYKILICPSDSKPISGGNISSTSYPADVAPRSYIYNSFNDFYYEHYQQNANWRNLAKSDTYSISEQDITEPSETVVFAEKGTGVTHWYLDYDYNEDITGIMEQSRHGATVKDAGGSNYTFADGSARYYRWGKILDPVNLVLVLPASRNQGKGGNPL